MDREDLILNAIKGLDDRFEEFVRVHRVDRDDLDKRVRKVESDITRIKSWGAALILIVGVIYHGIVDLFIPLGSRPH